MSFDEDDLASSARVEGVDELKLYDDGILVDADPAILVDEDTAAAVTAAKPSEKKERETRSIRSCVLIWVIE